MSAYLIVNYDVDDPDGYAEYQKGAGPALRVGSESELIVLDTNSTRLEGDSAGHQTVVLRFDDADAARRIYDSGEYQAVLPQRLGSTSKHFAILVDGFTMPT